jgi:hypothetical protein
MYELRGALNWPGRLTPARILDPAQHCVSCHFRSPYDTLEVAAPFADSLLRTRCKCRLSTLRSRLTLYAEHTEAK